MARHCEFVFGSKNLVVAVHTRELQVLRAAFLCLCSEEPHKNALKRT